MGGFEGSWASLFFGGAPSRSMCLFAVGVVGCVVCPLSSLVGRGHVGAVIRGALWLVGLGVLLPWG